MRQLNVVLRDHAQRKIVQRLLLIALARWLVDSTILLHTGALRMQLIVLRMDFQLQRARYVFINIFPFVITT